LRPQVLALPFRHLHLPIAGDNAVPCGPVALEGFRIAPALEGHAIEERTPSFVGLGDLAGGRVSAREWGEAEVPKVGLAPFRLQADVALDPAAVLHPGDDLAVDFQIESPIAGGENVAVPFAGRPAALLGRLGPAELALAWVGQWGQGEAA